MRSIRINAPAGTSISLPSHPAHRFGFFSIPATYFIVGGTFTERPFAGPTILHPELDPCRLPPEIEAAGATFLTGAMHRDSFKCLVSPMVSMLHNLPRPQEVDWPEEYGGNELRDRLAKLTFPEQIELLEIPAQSQYELMRRAIHAVCAVAFPESA